MQISEAGYDDVPAIAALMAASFAHDPVMAQFFPSANGRNEAMTKVFRIELEQFYIPLGVVDVVRASGTGSDAGGTGSDTGGTGTRVSGTGAQPRDQILGTALWAKPEVAMTRWDEAKMTARMARVLGRHIFQYMHLDRFDSAAAPKFPHWYLYTVAVDPQAQGQGVGGKLLEYGIARAGDSPIYLESTTEGSQKLYERKGFQPLGIIPSPIKSPEVGMWRPGRVNGLRRD
ncbi:MAG: GNAT family N-acetyltransferase [Ancrocorticia sp.]|uniref:GNAT family N-acetyltransferase n=1 Tax=Ancrocorticia sp. TaxID=2593684 RepID=UPI003F8E280B